MYGCIFIMDLENKFYHTVTLDEDKCKGCTNCIKRCPTKAIRVRRGKATIIDKRCIDCGECIRICPHHAKIAAMDSLNMVEKFKYIIALPAPALYGQFNNVNSISSIIAALKKIGFDEVYEVAKAAEIISAATRDYLKKKDIPKPIISSACPAVVRLIRVRFPELLDHILPFTQPVELAAKLARREAIKKTGLPSEDIGVVFISPCPAKKTAVVNPLGIAHSEVDLVLGIKDIFPIINQNLPSNENPDVINPEQFSTSGRMGVKWGSTGGEADGLLNESYMAVDGIENVIKVLEEIEDELFRNLEFVELNSCHGGCVGGVLTVDNAYAAKAKLHRISKYLPSFRNKIPYGMDPGDLKQDPIEFEPVLRLSDKVTTAIQMMQQIDEVATHFNGVDCGACGAPTCYTHAEDVVLGLAKEEDCIYHIRKLYEDLLKSVDAAPETLSITQLEKPEDKK